MIRKRSVWGYFALSVVALTIGMAALLASRGYDFPPEASLERVSGEIATVSIVDELSNRPIGLNTPLNVIHFTLENDDTIYRYSSGWPGYSDLYERLAFAVEIWVAPQDLSGSEPVPVYALEQTTPAGWPHPRISISYQQIVDSQGGARQSYGTLALVLLLLSTVVFIIGCATVRHNRRHRAEPKAD